MNLILRYVRVKVVIGNSHHGFIRGRLCLTSLISIPFERAQHVLFPIHGKDLHSHIQCPSSQSGERWDGWVDLEDEWETGWTIRVEE